MQDLARLLSAAGFRARAGATPAAISQFEEAIRVQLPDEFRALWGYSDGMEGDGINLLSLPEMEQYDYLATDYGYLPFTDCNDSNPYAICCRDPLRGMIAHIFHDDESRLVCRGLIPFLTLVAEARANGGDVDRLVGSWPFGRPERLVGDAATARELVRTAEKIEDDQRRGEALRFAAQLFGPGQEDDLAGVMTVGDEYVRDVVRRRLKGLGTAQAEKMLDQEGAVYRDFLTKLRAAFEAAGVKTEPTRQGAFCLKPGTIHPNFAMLYADCSRRSEAMDEWVQRLKGRLRKK